MTVCDWCKGTGKNSYRHGGTGPTNTPCLWCQKPEPRTIQL
jgi:hypothetical protein